MALRTVLSIFIICLLSLIYVYYKTRVKKCAKINSNISICYENRFNSGLYQINGMVADKKDSGLFNYDLFEKYYMEEDKFYYCRKKNDYPSICYYLADLKTSEVYSLKADDNVIIENKATKVEDIDYQSPYWLLVWR